MIMPTITPLGTMAFTGKSGKNYEFDVYSLSAADQLSIPAVYFVTKRHKNSNNRFSHKRIYVGESEDVSDRLDNHHKQLCFEREGANCICVFRKSDEDARLRIEKDLIDKYDPPCND